MNAGKGQEPSAPDVQLPSEGGKVAEVGTTAYVALPKAQAPEDKQLAALLQGLTEELQRQLGPELQLLMLYGSHARGEARPDSDVDLFVVLRRASTATAEKVRQTIYQVMWDADFAYVFSLYLTDVHHYQMLQHQNSSFLRHVQQEGRVLWKAA